MIYQVTLVSCIIAAITIQAKELDPGPQIFTNTNSSTSGAVQNQQKRFATKDVIVYLTPSQIKDLQAGKAELLSHSPTEITINQAPNAQNLQYQNPQTLYQPHLENIRILKAPLIQDPQSDFKQQEQQGIRYFNLPSVSSVNHATEQPKLSLFLPEAQRSEFHNFQNNNNNEWTPIAPVTETNLLGQSSQEQYKHWQSLEKNYEQLKHVSNIQYNSENRNPAEQYAPNYNPLIYALAQENALREQRNEIEKQRAIAQVNAIANSPPVIIHKEVQITKHKPVPVVKHVKVPVPTPVLVPVFQPYEVKVPQPYPVPVEVIKHIPVQVARAEKANAEKLAPYEVNRHAPGKNVYINVDSPSYLQVWKN